MHDLALAQRVRSWTYHRRRRLLRVQSGEGWTVAVMMIYSMSAVGGLLTVGFYNLADSIFLSRLPANDTPFLFLIPGALLLLIYALYHRLASRLRLPVLAVGSTVVLALTAIVLRVLLLVGFGKSFLLLLGIYLYCEVAASLVIAQFWTYAGQLFHPRQARRLFGLIGVGGTIGAIGFGSVRRSH